MLVSYERARAESLGLDARGGLMERAERFVFLGVALAFNIIVPVLWVMLVLTALTAVYRFVHVYRQAAHPPRVHTRRERRIGPRDDETLARSPAVAGCRCRTWWTVEPADGRGPDAPPAPVGAPQLASLSRARRSGHGSPSFAYRAGATAAQLVPALGRDTARPRHRAARRPRR